jgi:energy-converting hydrogenase Eha subunit E
MNAKREAQRQFAKEQELEKLRQAKEIKEQAQIAKLDAMTPEEQTVYTKKHSRKKLILAAAAALIIIGAIGAAAGGNKTTPSAASAATATTPTADAGAQLGCDHFRNVMSDVAAGLLTDSELRTKIKQVYESAYVSTNTGIAPAATVMLAAVTAGDTNGLNSAIKDFGTACTDLGL